MQVVWQESNSGAASLKCKMCELSVLVLKNSPILWLECASLSVAWPAVLGTSHFLSKQRKRQQKEKLRLWKASFAQICPSLLPPAGDFPMLKEGKVASEASLETELALCWALTPLLALPVSIPREQHIFTIQILRD